MKHVDSINFWKSSKEELLPGFQADFPYICTCAELDKFIDRLVPWHWHKSVELFYIEKGVLEYYTPKGKTVFPAGSGGFVNSNVLHMTKPQEGARDTIQLEHIFAPSFIGGQQGSLIEQKYVTPLITAPQLEVFAFTPENPKHTALLELLRQSFNLSEDVYAYEMRLHIILSEIWSRLLELSEDLLKETGSYNKANDKIKMMMIFIQEHYSEKLTITDIAASAFISERECFRTFNHCLHMTPIAYLNDYRLQKACRMLAEGNEKITSISLACGLGSSSYFGTLFRKQRGYTPMEYRNKWQDHDIYGQK